MELVGWAPTLHREHVALCGHRYWASPVTKVDLGAIARSPKLDGRAGDVSVGAVNAAIASFRFELHLAIGAIVEIATGVGRHHICRLMPALRTSQR